MSRTDYHRTYYRLYRSPRAAEWGGSHPTPRRSGRIPRLPRERYDDLVAWRSSSKRNRPKLWDLADQWGEDPGYLWYAARDGIKSYDRDRYHELLSLMRECVDEARASE